MVIELPGIALKLAQPNDLSQIVNLNRLAFAPQKSNVEIQQNWYPLGLNAPGHQQFLAIDEQTGLGVGTYTRLDFQVFLEGQEFAAKGIAAVAVAPERRSQRIARFMLEHELQALRSQQIPLALLYPFQHGFYRRLGWAWVGRVHQYAVCTGHVPLYPERHNVVAYQSDQHQAALQEVYLRSAQRHNGWLKRADWQWPARLNPIGGREIFCYVDAGKLLGYVILQYLDLPGFPQSSLAIAVQEWVALNADAYRGLVGFLAGLRDQVPTLIWNTYPEDPFPHLLQEQRRDPGLRQNSPLFGLSHRFGEIGAGVMWRLVDLATAFRLRPIRPGSPFILSFEVIDPVFGDQTITANFVAERMHPVTQLGPATLRLSVDHLTELFCGLRRVTELVWTKEVEFIGDRSLLSKLDAAWEMTPPFCWESF